MAVVASAVIIRTAQDRLMEFAFPYPADAVSSRDIICAAQSGRYMVAVVCAVAVSYGSGYNRVQRLSESSLRSCTAAHFCRESAATPANREPRRRQACVVVAK